MWFLDSAWEFCHPAFVVVYFSLHSMSSILLRIENTQRTGWKTRKSNPFSQARCSLYVFRLLGKKENTKRKISRWAELFVFHARLVDSSLPPSSSSPSPQCFLSWSNPPLDMLPLCSATLTSRLVPLLPGQPRHAPDNGMNVATLKPPEDAGRKHRSVSGGVITLYSPVNLSEERGLWVYGPICSPLPDCLHWGRGCSHICLNKGLH